MANRLDNLSPIQPGEVRNPNGHNQYTYRQDAEATFERLLRSAANRTKGETVAEAILADLCHMAQQKNTWAIDRVLERILPKVERREHTVPGVDPSGLADALDAFAARGATPKLPAGANGSSDGGSR